MVLFCVYFAQDKSTLRLSEDSSWVVSKSKKNPPGPPTPKKARPGMYIGAVGTVLHMSINQRDGKIKQMTVEMVAPEHEKAEYNMKGRVLQLTEGEFKDMFDVHHEAFMGARHLAMAAHVVISNCLMGEIYDAHSGSPPGSVTSPGRVCVMGDHVRVHTNMVVYGTPADLLTTGMGGAAPRCPELILGPGTILHITSLGRSNKEDTRGRQVKYSVVSPSSTVDKMSALLKGPAVYHTFEKVLSKSVSWFESDAELDAELNTHARLHTNDKETEASQIYDEMPDISSLDGRDGTQEADLAESVMHEEAVQREMQSMGVGARHSDPVTAKKKRKEKKREEKRHPSGSSLREMETEVKVREFVRRFIFKLNDADLEACPEWDSTDSPKAREMVLEAMHNAKEFWSARRLVYTANVIGQSVHGNGVNTTMVKMGDNDAKGLYGGWWKLLVMAAVEIDYMGGEVRCHSMSTMT